MKTKLIVIDEAEHLSIGVDFAGSTDWTAITYRYPPKRSARRRGRPQKRLSAAHPWQGRRAERRARKRSSVEDPGSRRFTRYMAMVDQFFAAYRNAKLGRAS